METQSYEPQYSGFWRRAGAAIVDGLIVGTIGAILTAGKVKPEDHLQIFMQIVAGFFGLFYGVLMECSLKQATIGKLILGIRVTDLDGNRISFLRSLARQCCKIFSGIILGLGYLFPLFTAKKQALHDLICGGVVIKQKIDF